MSEPVIEGPGVGSTETFLSIGKFNTKEEAAAVEKYIKTKFARAMLSVLKVTQNGNKPVWRYVPLQDFTDKSDINWNTSIKKIDLQLYKKYNLTKEEIDAEISKGMKSIEEGRVYSADAVEAEMMRDFGV